MSVGEQAHLFGGGGRQLRQVKAQPLGVCLAGIQPRQREQALHDRSQAVDLLEDAAEGLARLARERCVLRQSLQFAAHHGERRTQLVAGIRHELLGAEHGVLQAADHVIERH